MSVRRAIVQNSLLSKSFSSLWKLGMVGLFCLALTACGQTNTSTKSSEMPQQSAETPSASEEVAREVVFGNYPKDGETAEPIEWLVLDSKEDRVLLLAKDCIDSLPWHNSREGTTWSESDLRTWLNGEFLQRAFTTEEQGGILVADVKNGDDLKYGTSVGVDTQDRVFLLSGAEVEQYLPSDSDRTAQPTAYAISHGAYTNGSGDCAWWLRSPGLTETSPAYIASAGSFGSRAHEVDETIIGVRPALWVLKEKLDSLRN